MTHFISDLRFFCLMIETAQPDCTTKSLVASSCHELLSLGFIKTEQPLPSIIYKVLVYYAVEASVSGRLLVKLSYGKVSKRVEARRHLGKLAVINLA